MFFSCVEGLVPSQRVNGANPAYRLHGFVADYDAIPPKAHGQELVDHIMAKSPGGWAPTWVSRTWSGKARAVWEFEEPVMVDDEGLAGKFMDLFCAEAGVIRLLPGFDACSKSLTQYWELGTEWLRVAEASIPVSKTELLFFEAAKRASGPVPKVRIPMEVIAAKVDELFPGRWKGAFEPGARGPLFWLQDGVERTGAVVQEGGMWCFSTRAGKSFVPWSEILGASFVAEYTERRMQDAIENVWYDGVRYWTKGPDDRWIDHQKENFAVKLRLAGFSSNPRKKGDPASEMDEVLNFIHDHRRVGGVAPFVFNFDDTVVYQGNRFLNSACQKRVTQPAAGADAGDPAKWPHLWDWWNAWMDDPKSTHYLFAWLQRFYTSALEGRMCPGHTLIMAGNADLGKSLFAMKILPDIFGGGADAGQYLMGDERFNRDLCHQAVWQIDDNASASSYALHRRFSEMIKKVTAGSSITYRAMQTAPMVIERRGRVVITTNTDADSLDIIPNLDGTVLDKLLIVKLADIKPWFRDKSAAEIDEVIAEELPHALAWLARDYQAPEYVTKGASSRFGINAYHHPEIMALTDDLSAPNRDWELLELWWKLRGSDEPWEGNVTDLIGELSNYEGLDKLTRLLKPVGFGKTMTKLASKREGIHRRVLQGRTLYQIKLSW